MFYNIIKNWIRDKINSIFAKQGLREIKERVS